jgi:hypothetical protein
VVEEYYYAPPPPRVYYAPRPLYIPPPHIGLHLNF